MQRSRFCYRRRTCNTWKRILRMVLRSLISSFSYKKPRRNRSISWWKNWSEFRISRVNCNRRSSSRGRCWNNIIHKISMYISLGLDRRQGRNSHQYRSFSWAPWPKYALMSNWRDRRRVYLACTWRHRWVSQKIQNFKESYYYCRVLFDNNSKQ